jgi:hypothetical protein
VADNAVRTIVEAWQRMLLWLPEAELTSLLGPDLTPRLLGRLLVLGGALWPRTTELHEIPSETVPAERAFLFGYFSTVWSGRGDVVEIGPFLGGTTRAIALGMLANPACAPASRLHTYDRFDAYHVTDDLRRQLQPLVARGALPAGALDALGPRASFLDVFQRLHAGRDYGARIVARRAALRSGADDPVAAELRFALPDGLHAEAVFVDGCKSWFGTREFMAEVAPRLAPGAALIFQDYGWYTCFWLPAFVQSFADRFELFAHVHHTYAFRMVKPLAKDEVEASFPATPEALGRGALEALLGRAEEDAARRDDLYGVLAARLQRVGALAYIGARDAARAELSDLRAQRAFHAHRDMIAAASRSPTYRPEGSVLL